jgi:hypothetical protein
MLLAPYLGKKGVREMFHRFTPYPWKKGNCGGSVVSGTIPDHTPEGQKFYGGLVIAETVSANNMPLITKAPELFEIVQSYVALSTQIEKGRTHPRVLETWEKALLQKARRLLLEIGGHTNNER